MKQEITETSDSAKRERTEKDDGQTDGTVCRREGAPGRVWLVGAGPGAPDLITVRGYQLLREADVVVYDALILPETLEMIPEKTETIYVGKRAGAHSVSQDEICRILIREARLGKTVVRLKGGDPFVFGRGGEEAKALAEAEIPCEAVPGVTSAVAVPEAFGIPVTYRGTAESFTVITGHGQAENSRAAGAPETDYAALVRTGGTLVFLMGLAAAPAICRGLMDGGMDPDTPAAALSKGTTSSQRMVLSSVCRLADEIRTSGLKAPAVLVVGDVCTLSFWAGDSATVVVTRQEEKAEEFCSRIRALGMNVKKLPAIRIQKPEGKTREETAQILRELCGTHENERETESDDWLLFTSANGVEAFFDLLIEEGLDLRKLLSGRKKFAAVGPKTAEALRLHGILADLIPDDYTGEALGEALWKNTGMGDRERGGVPGVWFFGAKRTDGGLRKTLEKHGISLRSCAVYETVSAVRPEDAKRMADEITEGTESFLFTFTSASCVRNLVAALPNPEVLCGQTAVCIGRKTAEAAEEFGMRTVTARESTLESMLETLAGTANRTGKRNGLPGGETHE